MVVYPGKKPLTRTICAHYEEGACLTNISLSSGIGTHMDAPMHFYPKGRAIDQIPIDQCCGPLCVLHIAEKVNGNADYAISAEDIHNWEKANGLIPAESIFLAHTGWDHYWGQEKFCFQDDKGICHYPGFSKEAAELLVMRKVKGVGIDTLGIDRGCQNPAFAHIVLLKENLFLVENLANLRQVPAIGAFGYILPIKLEGAPEAPVRAIAVIDN